MKMNIFEIKDNCRANFNKYTRKAFESIPKIENPNILDLGCGTGVPTLEIANLTNGNILAIDSDKECLDWLKQKIKILNYDERISVIHGSVFTVNIPENNYDIILAEGLFNIIGFEKGLLNFSKFLKANGYFMIHDEFQNREKKLHIIEEYQFKLVESFILDENIWWNEYYSCLEKKIMDFEKEIANDINSNKVFKREKSEIDMYKKNPLKFRSIYYVLKKI